MKYITQRIGLDIILVGTLVFSPWWLMLGVGAMGAFVFPVYLEVVAAAFIMDSLFSAKTALFMGSQYVLTYMGILIYAVAAILRKITR